MEWPHNFVANQVKNQRLLYTMVKKDYRHDDAVWIKGGTHLHQVASFLRPCGNVFCLVQLHDFRQVRVRYSNICPFVESSSSRRQMAVRVAVQEGFSEADIAVAGAWVPRDMRLVRYRRMREMEDEIQNLRLLLGRERREHGDLRRSMRDLADLVASECQEGESST
ncbi:unknown protein [Seminavis robusta]|uniref:Uncharacterized protein n=1 Tax=Seminavis robusta TaxID=568900 RepID=A0A9N8EJE6_9STRA|nr:unknown protein [Seminavis robusta]|eukprot:Sro1082_g239210.1 n/a (166) ;mRNA; r:24240-24737